MTTAPKTIALLVTFAEAAHLRRIKAAAGEAGMTTRAWARGVLLSASRRPHAPPGASIPSQEGMDALEALAALGIGQGLATQRVEAALRRSPELTAAEIIKDALRQAE